MEVNVWEVGMLYYCLMVFFFVRDIGEVLKDFFKLFLYICIMIQILISFGISLIATIVWVFGTDIDAVDDDVEFP